MNNQANHKRKYPSFSTTKPIKRLLSLVEYHLILIWLLKQRKFTFIVHYLHKGQFYTCECSVVISYWDSPVTFYGKIVKLNSVGTQTFFFPATVLSTTLLFGYDRIHGWKCQTSMVLTVTPPLNLTQGYIELMDCLWFLFDSPIKTKKLTPLPYSFLKSYPILSLRWKIESKLVTGEVDSLQFLTTKMSKKQLKETLQERYGWFYLFCRPLKIQTPFYRLAQSPFLMPFLTRLIYLL